MTPICIRLAVLLLSAVCAGAADAAEDPLNCQEAMSTAQMNTCAEAELTQADAQLNAAYQKALSAIPDMATADPPFDANAWEAALRASQRAWVAFRDAECEGHVAMFWTGGSGATVDILGCKTEKTEARIRELKGRYESE